jgi:subtilisin family serine protease
MSKVDPHLQDEARKVAAGGTVGIIVVSQGQLDVTEGLQRLVRGRPDANGLTFTSAQASPSQLARLAGAPNVITILSNTPPEIPPLPEPQYARPRPARGHGTVGGYQATIPDSVPQSQGSEAPDSWHTIDIHRARDAWAQGYRGNGVKVAVLDSGVDFGHADLQGTFARVDDPNSPYFGWPYVVDPYSMELLAWGVTHDVPEAIRGYGSWYVDTHTTVRGSQAQFMTVTATASEMRPITFTYTLPGTSQSGTYHMGIHPDEHLAFDRYGQYPAVLVADTLTPGVYDTVYVDLNANHDFRDDAPQRRGSEIATRDTDGDAIPDLSSGLLYFIADGRNPIPASDWLFGILPPGNGDLVALFGSMDYAEDHGTFCASSVVAQGKIDGASGLRPPYKPAGVGGMVQGIAPGAKIVAIGNIYRSNLAVYNSMLLATLGLDGRPNSGDEPQVASMSFGYSGGWNNGWDYMSRYLLYLSQYNPDLTYMAATGNGGPGFGTVTPPASSPAVIGVGAATQYGETTTFESITSTDRITWGDVQPWSNRGPTHMGQPKPDVLAVGAWGTGDVPINMSANGSVAYDVWGGTSMSTPTGAGVAALVYQAYRARTGHWPTADEVRTLLTSSALDLNYNAFAQGAGLLDAGRAVQMARGASGVAISPSSWVPGTTAPGYAGVVRPGEVATGTFTLRNLGSAAASVTVTGQQLVQTSQYEWTQAVTNTLESDPDFKRPDYLWNMISRVPPDTDLLKVSAVMSFTDFSRSDPRTVFLGVQSAWRLLAYDWRDDNHDGVAWRDTNSNGVVNAGELQSGEINRLTYGYNLNDMVELYVERPRERMHDGVLIGLQHQIANRIIPTSTLHLKITTYRKQPWSWLATPPAAVSIPPNGSASFSVRAQAPTGTATGAYEGSLSMNTGSGHDTIVPVALNVRADGIPATLGGANRAPQTTTFDNGRISGQANWGWRPETGDWRHYYVNNTAQPAANTFVWASANWATFPTDLDLILGQPSPWDWFSQRNPAIFGPHGMDGFGSSVYTNLGNGSWQWRTNTDTNTEWVAARLGQTGLHEAVVHDVFYSGMAPSESFTATLGTVQLSADNLQITTNRPSDSATLTMTTGFDLPGIRARAYGLSRKETWRNIGILPQHTWFTETNVSDVASVEFSTDAPDGVNVDLYVDHWENGRYVWLGASAGPEGREFVRIEPALPGNYRVRVDAARDVPTGARFDYSLKAIAGTDMSVSPLSILNTVPAGTTLTFTVGFNRPSITEGVWDGTLFLGPYDAPALQSLPVRVVYGNPEPTPTDTPRPCRIRFTDVPPGDWAYNYITELYCRGIVSGYLDQTFRPGEGASRVQIAKMIVLIEGWSLQRPATPTFRDVSEFAWGYEYVETAVAHGIIGGYADNTFRPSNPVTRGQFAKMIVLAEGWTLADPATASFTDVPRGSAFFPYVETAVSHALISGYSDHTFRPGNGVTRAQLCKMLVQALHSP